MTGDPLPTVDPNEPDALADLAQQALQSGQEEAAIPVVRAGAERHRSALLWQWTALIQRALDEHAAALESFAEASRLAPDDFKIAQGRAHTALEAGVPATALYEQARALAPRNGPVLIGLCAARAAQGEGERAAADLRAALGRAPMWHYGHEQFAQIVSTLGRPKEATSSVEEALRQFPGSAELWGTLLNLELRRGNYAELRTILDRASAAGVRSPEFAIYAAIHAAEYDDSTFPEALFEAAPASIEFALGVWRVRHLLRVGEVAAALPIVERELEGSSSAEIQAYAATVWRLAGDPRSEWLEGAPELVQTFDLTAALPPLDTLAETLRALHLAKGEYLDQSVRGGTQTDGPLFSRIDPVIRSVRAAAAGAVEQYVANLPPIDERHPLLGAPRDRRIRFAGSWSVRLRSGGRHSNHVHPQGWISSALYVALPDRAGDEPPDSGWLTLGQPDDNLRLDLEPAQKIEPLTARLVLFPSWMWHGTRPFAGGERLTVAFDVARPL